MPNRIDMGLHAGAQALRLGWYWGLNRIVEWRSSGLGERPRFKPTRPVPTEAEVLAALRFLLQRDAEAVRDGIYPPLPDAASPLRNLARARDMFADVPDAFRRRQSADAASARAEPAAAGLPAYYTQDFHFQSGGYLSEQSARLYDTQVETLFLGGAAPMRREALRPIAEFMRGRDQRAVSLLDVATGTGRFLRDLRLAWPAMRLSGLDLSASYLAEAERHLGDLRPATWLRANAEAMPLPDASQDIVTTIFLFHELPPEVRRQVAAEMSRVLKPGGLLVFVDSLQIGDRPGWDGLLEGFPARFHEPYYRSYAIDDLAGIFRAAGLEQGSSWTSFFSKIVVCGKPATAR